MRPSDVVVSYLVVVVVVLLLATTAPAACAQQLQDYPTTSLLTPWVRVNNEAVRMRMRYFDGSDMRAIVYRLAQVPYYYRPRFAAGFFCPPPCDGGDKFLFAVFLVGDESGGHRITKRETGNPHVVWSANRSRPVRENATLELNSDGNLILRDADGTLVWSTGTSGRSVAAMGITEDGNLVLFDHSNATVWQSFDHPTDALVPGQSLMAGMRLRANTSATNWAENQVYMTLQSDGLYGYVESTPPQPYYSSFRSQTISPLPAQTASLTKVTLLNGSLSMYGQFTQAIVRFILPAARSIQYMRLESDGHLRLYEWSDEGLEWTMVTDVIKPFLGDCDFPTVCGKYGICTGEQCTCPHERNSSSSYFEPVDDRNANLGCTPVTPISCQEMQSHQLLTLTDVSYFDVSHTYLNATNRDDCKQACLKNCSCRAVIFRHRQNDSSGTCIWVTEVFSLQTIQPKTAYYNSSAYLKVQLGPSASASTENKAKLISGIAFAAAVVGLLLAAAAVAIYKRKRRKLKGVVEELDFDLLPGMPMQFSYEMLKECTGDFNHKLGEGGFGSVFEGIIGEERVAVKRLESARQGKKEFLAEVETIGSIEHINLVKLMGFCAEKSNKLLVYEYMPKGSLDKWIYYHHNNAPLDWCTRRRIIMDIAKGLCYLHEECRRKIVHLDIKPQNILLDDKFNAKVADFGLSKLIDRDQSKVVTGMRGTPGYLAPEWLTSQITEKVDVYSFGVVLMEVISGRKNIDHSQPEEGVQLINFLWEKAQNNQLIDMIDKHSDDMGFHLEEVIQMMKLAMWCLQHDSSRRPSMSMVVKVLEGGMSVETSLEYGFINKNPVICFQDDASPSSAPPPASILSGPR